MQVVYGGQHYDLHEQESVLDALTRHGVSIPSSCRSGICGTCTLRAVKGTPPAQAQQGLKENLRAQNYFHACVCRPTEDLEVALPGQDVLQRIRAYVTGKEPLSKKVMRLRLQVAEGLDYRAGQFVNLYRDDGLTRTYSLASIPGRDEPLELHIQYLPGGRMSGWVHHDLAVGDAIEMGSPQGECFYTLGNPEQPLLLVATGSGLAPLWGIVGEALAHGHTGPIALYHGSHDRSGLYLVDELQGLAERHPNFNYIPCISGPGMPAGYTYGRANDVAMQHQPKLQGWKVYLCGHPDMVKTLKRQAFLAGASLRDIHADPFVIQN